MPIFSYKVKDAAGKLAEGAVEAESEAIAAELLRERGLQLMSLERREEVGLAGRQFTFLQRVTPKDLVIFSRQLSVMVGAAVTIVRALRTSARQTRNSKLRRIVTDVADEVEGGVRLSEALGKYPSVFGSFYIKMVRSGETTGKLDEVLLYLAD